jgi:SAM-dependent methyltransferase
MASMDVTPDPIMRIAMGFMAAKHLFVASEIGIFQALASGPATLDQIAERSGVPHRTVRISVDAMASLGLLELQGHRYSNSAVAAAFLSGASGPDLRPMLRFWDRISYPAWLKLEDAVRTGEGQSHFDGFSADEQRIFSLGVESFSAPAAASLADSYDFGQHRRVLDVAGGTGSFLIPVLRRHPSLSGTLFELPGACAVARQRLANEPERARVEVVEGDLFKDELPGEHDAVIVANTVHVLSAAHNLELFRKIRASVGSGARLLLVDLWTDPSHTQPPAAALMSGEFLIISGEGQAYGEEEGEAWLQQTGWRKLERKPLTGPASVVIAESV